MITGQFAHAPLAKASGMLSPDVRYRQDNKDWERGTDLTGDGPRTVVWEARVTSAGVDVRLEGDGAWQRALTLTGVGPSASITFDQLMRPMVTYKLDADGSPSTAYLYWYDQVMGGYVTRSEANVRSPLVTFDYFPDPQNNLVAEVLWFYVRSGTVYYRRQRDRFTIEYPFAAMPAGTTKITGAGLGRNWRLHIRCSI